MALLFLLLAAFPSQLFNKTLEENYAEVVGWFTRGGQAGVRIRDALAGFWQRRSGLIIFVAISALLYGFLSPQFGPTIESFAALIGILGGLAIVIGAFELPLLLFQRRINKDAGMLRVQPLTIFIGIACVVISRIADFQPGYLYGLVAAYAFARELPLRDEGPILLLRQSAQRRSEEPFHLGRSHALSHGAFAWLVASAFIIAANSFAYDAARFREGDAAVGLGYDATTVDAGYEWVGIHAVGDENETFEPKGLNWWQNLFPSFRPCAILSNAPFDVPGYELVRENPSAYRQYLLLGPAQPLYLYGADLAGCPTPHPVELTSGG